MYLMQAGMVKWYTRTTQNRVRLNPRESSSLSSGTQAFDLAYVVGLITTDGSLSKDGRHIDFTSKDLEQIKTFKKILKLTNKIGTKTNGLKNGLYYRIQFSNIKFYKWLLEIGLMPNKSLRLASLKIDERYFRDFLRGHLDGDGSIIYYKDKYNTKINKKYIYDRLFVYFISASKEHLDWLQNNILEKVLIKGSINNKRANCFVLKFSTQEAKILLNWIYYRQNLPCLKRKFKVAEPFIKFI